MNNTHQTAPNETAVDFEVDGVRCTRAEFLASNADDQDAVDWAMGATPGDRFAAIVDCVAVVAAS